MPSFEEWVLLEGKTNEEVLGYFQGLVALLEKLGVAFFNMGPAKSARGRSLLLDILQVRRHRRHCRRRRRQIK